MINRYFLILLILYSVIPVSAFQLEVVNGNGSAGLINRSTNKFVLPKSFETIGWPGGKVLENDLIRVQKNQHWALYKTNGKAVTAHDYVSLTPFQSNFFIASKRSSYSVLQQFGLIDQRGREIIPFDFLRIAATGNRLLATENKGSGLNQKLFDEKGKLLIDGDYSRIEPLNDQFFAVTKADKLYALFDEDGHQKTPFEFQMISSLKNRVFLISYYNRLGVINSDGSLIVPPIHRRIFLSADQVKTEGYPEWTLFKNQSRSTLYFDEVKPLGDSLLIIQSGTDVGIINANEEYLNYINDHEVIQATEAFAVIKRRSTGRYGLINNRGIQILASNYDSIIALNHYALAKIERQSNEHWIAIDLNGQSINSSGYAQIQELTKSQGAIVIKNEGMGLLSAYGKEITPFDFRSVERNDLGHFIVKTDRGIGLMNENGDWLISPYKDSISLNKTHYTFTQGSAYGLADLNGKQLAQRYEVIDFLPGGYRIMNEDHYQVYSFQDSLLFDYEYDTVYALNDKLWLLQRDSKTFIYRHEDGNVALVRGIVDQIGKIKENYISFKQDGQWGYLDELGQLRIANRYDSVTQFSEGLAAVKLIGKWGAINREEEIIVQPEYDSISDFYNSLAVVKAGGKYGLVDRTGRDVLDLKYDKIVRHESWIRLEIGPLVGISDIRGRIIKIPQYNEVQAFGDGYFLVRKGFSYGVTDQKGNDLIPVVYDKIQKTPLGFLTSKKGTMKSYPLQ